MIHTSRQHFLHAVLPALCEFVDYHTNREIGLRRDTQRAAILAGSLRDLPEHVFGEINDPNCVQGYADNTAYREAYCQLYPSYRLVCNFADAWKHRRLNRKVRMISSVDDIVEYHMLIRHEDEKGFYYLGRPSQCAHVFHATLGS